MTKPDSNHELFRKIYGNITDFAGRFALSAALQLPITTAINLGAGKVSGVSYSLGAKNLSMLPFGQIVNQGLGTLKRRTYSSLLPSSISSAIAGHYNLSPTALTAINTGFESFIASFVTRESSERFNAVTGKDFPLLCESGKGVDLTKITTETEFLKYCKNNPQTSSFDAKKWEDLNARIANYNRNLPYQAALLSTRNAIFSSAIFMAKPTAQEIVKEYGEQIDKSGMSRDAAETMVTYSLRAALAWSTTCFDRAFTMLSSGQHSFEDVYKIIGQDFASGNFNRLFGGAGARTVLCLLTATTVAEGPAIGKMIREQLSSKGNVDKAIVGAENIDATVRWVGSLLSSSELSSDVQGYLPRDIQNSLDATKLSDDEFGKGLEEFLLKVPSEVVEFDLSAPRAAIVPDDYKQVSEGRQSGERND